MTSKSNGTVSNSALENTGALEKTATRTAEADVLDLSVVVPAYNEERRLGPTLDALTRYLERAERAGDRWGTWEILVADDGSTDATREIVALRRDPRLRLVSAPARRGKGHALRLGVAASRGRRVLVTDADLAAPAEELERLEAALADGRAAAAIGSRAVPGATLGERQHRVRELVGTAGNALIRATSVRGIRDTQCGFKLFDGDRARAAFAASRVNGWAIDVEVLRHFQRSGWPVAEVPVHWSHRPGSKIRPPDYLRFLVDLARIRLPRPRPADMLAAFLFLAMAVALCSGRFFDPAHRYLTDSLQDQNQWEWFFAVTADNVSHLRNPFFTDLQGFPDGVNLMANTAMLGLSVPLTPVTLLLGPALALSLVMTLGLAATAAAWYRLIVKRLVRQRGAAFAGAALAAFAPPMVSHANAHPNFVVLFMIPPIIDRALRLTTGARVTRDAIALGLLAAYQFFLGEEPLLLAALGMLLFAAAYAAVRPQVARRAVGPVLRGLAIAAAVCLPLVVYPLAWQFSGPQSYTGIDHGDAVGTANSVRALLSFAERSLIAGDAARADALSLNPTEQNAFYGWPLALLALAITVRLWRRPAVKALACTAAGAAVLSLGPRVPLPLTDTTVPGPWALLDGLPLFESVIESRVALVCAPALGMLLALAIGDLARARRLGTQYAGLLAVCLALLPLVPAPLKSEPRTEAPAFFTDGTWKSYVRAGETLVPVPLAEPEDAEALHWQTAAGLGFRMPGGYFNGPYGDGDRTGVYGVPLRWTASLLRDVRYTGVVPVIDARARAEARQDLAYWRAGALVLAPQKNDDRLRETVRKLVGRPGRQVGGVWVWDLHATAHEGR
ncbi:glycosyltransferase family 2 protein [Streptomyces sp. NBC_01275]|uniref:dolichyl-phosphate beta-glucosyltransferase n=1 Tax=Streptomyces sp. NBC_01275 TaxID=2903807 RepID=UPI00224DF4A5|nr:dolichyl-phosphate beta-glucosyltransferase [Streptomyces sp. NBC_01275]MCX4763769.1 glycosyltransferase family 2 protein [Streptomyces sp. NBC_01275]